MRRGPALSLLTAVLLAGATCDRTPGERGDAPPNLPSPEDGPEDEGSLGGVAFLTGLVTFGHEVRSFRPCGAGDDLWVLDESGEVGRFHKEFAPGQDPYEEVFMALMGTMGPPPADGFGAEYPGTLLVEEVQYAGREGFGCDSDWAEFRYRAYGNEPFWDLEISEDGLRLRRLGEDESHWDSTRIVRTGPTATVVGLGSNGDSILVMFTSEPCRDSMSGAHFGLTAEIQGWIEALRGCGFRRK